MGLPFSFPPFLGQQLLRLTNSCQSRGLLRLSGSEKQRQQTNKPQREREREREERKSSRSTRFRFKHFWERGVGDRRHTLHRRNSLYFTKSPFCNLQVTTIVKQFSFKRVFCFFFVVCVRVCGFFFFFGFWSPMSFLFSSIFFISLAPNAQAIYFDLLSSSSVIISIINTVILFFSHSSWHLFLCIVFLLL